MIGIHFGRESDPLGYQWLGTHRSEGRDLIGGVIANWVNLHSTSCQNCADVFTLERFGDFD